MKNVYAVAIPVRTSDGNDVDYLQFLFNQPPTRQDVINAVENLYSFKENTHRIVELDALNLDVKDVINQIVDWKMLTGALNMSTAVVNVATNKKIFTAQFNWYKLPVYDSIQ